MRIMSTEIGTRIIHFVRTHFYDVLGILIIVSSCLLSLFFHKTAILAAPIVYYGSAFLLEYSRYSFQRKRPLLIKTPDGFNEPYHPSVVFFDKPWNGFSYWMAFSPMPKKGVGKPYIDRWECPCVYQSQGGLNLKMLLCLVFLMI